MPRHTLPAKEVERLPQKKKLPRFLSKEEVQQLLKCSDGLIRDAIILLINTGMRAGKLVGLTWKDIDSQAKEIHLKETKTNKERKIPINQAAIEVLKKRRKIETDWVFSTNNNGPIHRNRLLEAFKRICKKAKIENANLHTLRHTCASHLVMLGVDIPTIAKILGHSDIKTTMIYAHLAQGHLRQAVERLTF